MGENVCPQSITPMWLKSSCQELRLSLKTRYLFVSLPTEETFGVNDVAHWLLRRLKRESLQEIAKLTYPRVPPNLVAL